MAVQLRERTQRTGEHSHKDIYSSHTYALKHICNHAVKAMQVIQARQKNNYRSIIIYTQSLNISLLARHGATTFIQRNPRKGKG